MPCELFESQLLDYVENRLPAVERARVENHLAGCAECRACAAQLEQLDAQLARAVKPPRLSPAFQSKLRQRIQATPLMTAEQIAARKLQLQAEYEAGLRRLDLFHLPARRLLQSFAYFAALAASGWIVWCLLPHLTSALARANLNFPGQEFLPFVLTSAPFVVLGLATAFPQCFLRMRHAGFVR